MRMGRMLASLLLATASLGLIAANTITATLTASPVSYTGKCPTVITFKGTITVTEPCKVQYKFLRSDNANAPVQTLDFVRPGTQPVSTTWTLGASYVGWQAIEVIYPQHATSNRAEFKLVCGEARPEVRASLTASPVDFTGKCPAVIKFDGQISATAPCTVTYKFIRSDNALAPVQTLVFTQAGTKPVSTTWTLGGAALPTYAGWEAIEILSPVVHQSNHAQFKITCTDGKPEVRASLTASPAEFTGKCPAVIKFDGQISATAPCTVTYKFIRSDNALAPVQTLVFTQAGTKPVSTTWTLGGAALPTYTGWEAIEILSPVVHQSNHAAFKITCTDVQPQKKADLGMYGFLKLGKLQREVKWNETIVLGPEDASLVSNGKPAFEVYYSHREFNGVAVPGPFKNKITFEGAVVSIQSALALAASEIKPIHTQAYLGPKNGRLTIKIDADGEVQEAREDNNEFSVNIVFRGF